MDGIGKFALPPIDFQNGGLGMRAIENHPLPINGNDNIFAGTPNHILIAVPIHHKQVARRKRAAAEQLRRASVQCNLKAVVNQVQAGRNENTNRRCVFRVIDINGIGKRVYFEVIACNGNAPRVHFQRVNDALAQPLQSAAAAGKEHCRRYAAIDLLDFRGNLGTELFCCLVNAAHYFIIRNFLLEAQHVNKGDIGAFLQLGFYDFCRLEINKVFLHYGFRHFISGNRRHSIANHAAIAACGDIRRPRADISKRKVQQAEAFGYRGIDCRNRLQRDAGNLQADFMHGGIQAFHHLARQKRCNDIRADMLAMMVFQAGHHVIVQIILTDRIAHQIKTAVRLFLFIFPGKLRLCRADGSCLQTADGFLCHKLHIRQFNLIRHALGTQSAPCRRNTDAFQLNIQLFFQPLFDLSGQSRNLIYIFYLPVYHSAAGMLRLFHRQNVHAVVLQASHHANDASCSNIQCKNQVILE